MLNGSNKKQCKNDGGMDLLKAENEDEAVAVPGKHLAAALPGAVTPMGSNIRCTADRSDLLDSFAKSDSSKSDEKLSESKVRDEPSKKSTDEKVSETDLEYGMSNVTLESAEPPDMVMLNQIVDKILNGQIKNIITLAGAGISTAAGIPDFRTPGSGLYSKLKKYNLPYPSAIFEIDYFKENPRPFFQLVKEMMPGSFEPTYAHHFVNLLNKRNVLLRHYTQNIDNLERAAGICADKLVEAHGTFYTSHCMKCDRCYSLEWFQENLLKSTVPLCEKCNAIVKPDITFFGEVLPKRFFNCVATDFQICDLLLIMGSSLAVEPFASLVLRIDVKCPRIIINNMEVGQILGISYEPVDNPRDVFLKGTCDEGCQSLVEKLGWTDDIAKLQKNVKSPQDCKSN